MKKIITLLVAFMLSLGMYASQPPSETLTLHPSSSSKDDGRGNPSPRSIQSPLFILKENHKLILPTNEEAVEMIVMQSNDIVYQDIISAETSVVEIPANVQGDCVIQLTIGETVYIGKVQF